jgi:peptidoglycan/xylan/chitin deacetylase (PgdA/CDA1 family)
MVPILAYHKVQSDFDLSVTRVSPLKFERQIKYLSENGFKTISIDMYLSGRNNADNEVIITFDDAYESIFNLALPILSKYNFTATIFVITDFVGKLNSWDYGFSKFRTSHCNWHQLRQLSQAGWEIGSHTNSHRNLRALCDHEVVLEVENSKSVLEEKLGQRVKFISYPYGKFDERVLSFVEKAGYDGACTVGGYENHVDASLPYRLPRRSIYLFEPVGLFKYKVQNSKWTRYDDFQQKIITICANGAVMLRHMKSV